MAYSSHSFIQSFLPFSFLSLTPHFHFPLFGNYFNLLNPYILIKYIPPKHTVLYAYILNLMSSIIFYFLFYFFLQPRLLF